MSAGVYWLVRIAGQGTRVVEAPTEKAAAMKAHLEYGPCKILSVIRRPERGR